MNVPLYRADGGAWGERSKHPAANLGLVFDKCFGGWEPSYTDYASNSAKHDWVKRIANASKGGPRDVLREAVGRQRELVVGALGGKAWPVKATSRFVTGTGIANPLENGFAFHHSLGVPYLPATGLKGALRAYWEQWHQVGNKDALTERLFGKRGAGSVVFFDMLPTAPPELVPEVMTPHYGAWYAATGAAIAENAPGDWMSPTPIPFLAVEAGAMFQIAIAPRRKGDQDWPEHKRHLEDILHGALGTTGAGAKTAVGYGRFALCGDDGAEAGVRASGQTAASPGARASPARAKGGAPAFAAGETLGAGTRLSWGEVGNVVLSKPVTLLPGIKLPVRFVDDESMEDELPISEISELRHIK
jgi:CRISPR-associated protein Cmr6